MLRKRGRALGFAVLFLGLVGLTLRRLDWSALWDTWDSLRLPWLGVACGMMVLFFALEGRNLQSALGLFGSPAPYGDCVRYGLTGFFFSAVTPSSSGGQPMELAAMGRGGHKAAPGGLALLTVFLSYQGASFLWAGMGVCLHWETLTALEGGFGWCFLLGLALSMGLAAVLVGAVCSPRLLPFVFRQLVSLVRLLSPSRSQQLMSWGEHQWSSLRTCLAACRSHPGVLVGMFFVSVVQLGAYHSVPLWVRLALGEGWVSPVSLLSLQGALYLAVSSLPLPGGVGISEGGFMAVFNGIFSLDSLSIAVLLNRGVSFYLPVVLTGCFLFPSLSFSKKNAPSLR